MASQYLETNRKGDGLESEENHKLVRTLSNRPSKYPYNSKWVVDALSDAVVILGKTGLSPKEPRECARKCNCTQRVCTRLSRICT